jgi:glutamate 5-kinase
MTAATSDPLRYKRVVVKVGTAVLTASTDRLHRPRLVDLVRQLAALRAAGGEPILVTSGAVLAGWEQLGFPPRKRTLPEKQLFAAIGQGRLMQLYAHIADLYSLGVAQTLLTRDDLRDRRRYLNARTTLLACLEREVLPIVNENDVVATDEIKVGDNDTLSARVAALVEADLLLVLTDQPGLMTADPATDPAAHLVEVVETIDESIWALAGGTTSPRGTGGMRTKLEAADLATRAGVETAVVGGALPDVVLRVARGERCGTTFLARPGTRLEARKRWILAETVKAARIAVDGGAEQALRRDGRSLLPAGIVAVEGAFERGQTVRICSREGQELACGLVRYGAADLRLIAGKKSARIGEVLGYDYGAEAVHRDDMVLL